MLAVKDLLEEIGIIMDEEFITTNQEKLDMPIVIEEHNLVFNSIYQDRITLDWE